MQKWWLQLQVYLDDYLTHLCGHSTFIVSEKKELHHDLANNLQLATEMHFKMQQTELISNRPYALMYNNLVRSYNLLNHFCPGFIRRDLALELRKLTIILHQLNTCDPEKHGELNEQVTTLIKNIEQDLTDASMIVYYMRFMDRAIAPVLRKLAHWRWYLANFRRIKYGKLLQSLHCFRDVALEGIRCLQDVSSKRRAYKLNPMQSEIYKKVFVNLKALHQCQLQLQIPADIASLNENLDLTKINFPELAKFLAVVKSNYFYLYSNLNYSESESNRINNVLDLMQSALTKIQTEIQNLESHASHDLSLENYQFKYSKLHDRSKELDVAIKHSIPLGFRIIDSMIHALFAPITSKLPDTHQHLDFNLAEEEIIISDKTIDPDTMLHVYVEEDMVVADDYQSKDNILENIDSTRIK